MIRTFQLQDAPLVSRLQSSGIYLDLRRALLWHRDPLPAAMWTYVPFRRGGVRTLVLRDALNGADASGFVQYRERFRQPEADIIFCAPAIDRSPSEPVGQHIWQRLLYGAVTRLGERGCERIYTRLLDGASEMDVFWQLGFSAYARDRVYAREGLAPPSDAAPSLWRPQRAADQWNVGQLYTAITPKLVQQAEHLPQRNSFAPYRDQFGSTVDRRYVVGDGEIVSSLRVIRGQGRCWLKWMLHPTRLKDADRLFRDGLRLVPPSCEVLYVSVREYQSELQGAILRAGFRDLETEVLMVKHTTVLARQPALKAVPAIEGIEASPTGLLYKETCNIKPPTI